MNKAGLAGIGILSMFLAGAACSSSGGTLTGSGGSGGGTSSGGSGGSSASGGTGGSTATGGRTGTGGLLGTGGTTPGTGGSAPGTGGSAPGTGGTTPGTGGTRPGTGGVAGGGGSRATGGSTGSGGKAGAPGSGGSAAGSSGATGGSGGSVGMGSTGCGKTSTLTFGMVPGESASAAAGSGNGVGHGDGGYVTIQSGGGTRGFALRLPDNYDKNKAYPLYFGFHWNGGNSAQVDNGGTNGYWWAYYGMQRKSNNSAIFVAPDGLSAGWANTGGRDLQFADDMVKLIESNYCVDTGHIVTMGFSYGGGMSYELACSRAKVFHAAVIYEGGQLSGCDGGNDPIALWQTEGLTDGTVNMSFATPIRDRFVKNNQCMSQNPPQPPQPPPYLSSGGHVCTDYAGCSAGHPVRWCVHQSGHTPGPIDGTSDLYNSCATPPKTCSASCPCTWTPDDVWSWLNSF